MTLIPLEIPPGVYRNGTDLQSSGRWRDASLVRWTDGTMQPVGGWISRVTMSDQPIRGAIAWRDLTGDRWFAGGTFEGLFVSNAINTVSDITPASFVTGSSGATQNTGYGGAFYGTGAYGLERPDTGAYSEATVWSLDTWGEYLVGCATSDGRLVEWTLSTGTPAAAISNAPTGCSGLFVTEERFLFALAPSGNYRRVAWSDREDNTTWTAAATNEAGDFDLQTAGQIMLGIRSRGQSLILTNLDAHSVTYQGPPFVYGFERVGSSCGAISRQCAASVDSGVYWMGERGFFRFAGGAVESIPCDVMDYVFDGMNTVQKSRIAAVTNRKYSEIWWFYPGDDSTENSRYVVYNYKEGHWATGLISRTCGIDAGVFNGPIWFSASGLGYDHEAGTTFDGSQPYAESGPMQVGAGDNVVMATQLIPDEKTQGDVTVTFATRFYPNGTETEYGPFSMAAPTDIRFTARQVAMKVTGGSGRDWRWGIPRINGTLRGTR